MLLLALSSIIVMIIPLRWYFKMEVSMQWQVMNVLFCEYIIPIRWEGCRVNIPGMIQISRMSCKHPYCKCVYWNLLLKPVLRSRSCVLWMCDTLHGFILYLIYAINYVWGLGCYISSIRAGWSIRPGCLIIFVP